MSRPLLLECVPAAVVTVVSHTDDLLLGSRVLGLKGPVGGVLHHLASDPPTAVLRVSVVTGLGDRLKGGVGVGRMRRTVRKGGRRVRSNPGFRVICS